MSQYPENLEAALGQPLTFRPSTLRAVQAFADSKPWRGTLDERLVKFRQLHADLCGIYGVNPTLVIEGDGTGDSGGSSFQPGTNVITLTGRLMVMIDFRLKIEQLRSERKDISQKNRSPKSFGPVPDFPPQKQKKP